MNKLSIQVEFEGKTKEFKFCTRREVFTAICKYFNVTKEKIQLFDMEQQKIITINDLGNNMKVKIRRLYENGDLRESVGKQEIPDQNTIVQKLRENKVLSGFERKFIVERISLLYHEVQEPKENLQLNKGVQVLSFKNAKSQTVNPSSLIVDLDHSSVRKKKRAKKTDDHMEDSFIRRRNFILMENPELKLLKRKYPQLFTIAGMHNELNRIFHDGKDMEFIANIEDNAATIISLAVEDDPILKHMRSVQKDQKYGREVAAILLISKILQQENLFLNTQDDERPESNYPHIKAKCKFDEIFHDAHPFYVVVENITACKTDNFKEAVLCLMACYFIFNISYPDDIFDTLVTMEKIFLEAPHTEDKDIDNSTKQVIKLIKLKTDSRRPKDISESDDE